MKRLLALLVLPFVIAAGTPNLPAPGPTPLPPPATPAPLAPPTAAAPAPSTNFGPSPILTQPGPIYPAAPSPGAAVSPPAPSAIDQQKLGAYRSSLLQQQRQLEDQGVSPADPRLREIQQQLNQPGQ
jgi:hypothetical protein